VLKTTRVVFKTSSLVYSQCRRSLWTASHFKYLRYFTRWLRPHCQNRWGHSAGTSGNYI